MYLRTRRVSPPARVRRVSRSRKLLWTVRRGSRGDEMNGACAPGGWSGEGGLGHRLQIARGDIRYCLRHKRFVALARVLWTTLILRHYGETCQECGRRYCWTVWHAPDALWLELMGRSSGLLCPRCFTAKAHEAGHRLFWSCSTDTHYGLTPVDLEGNNG